MNFFSPNYQISWFESRYDKDLERFLLTQLGNLIKKDSNYQIYFNKNSDNHWLIFLFINQEKDRKLFHFNVECFREHGNYQNSLHYEEIKKLIEISFPYELITGSILDIVATEYLKTVFLKNLEENSFKIF